MSRRLLTIAFFVIIGLFAAHAQVIQAPILQCVENDNSNGNITLAWTNPAVNPCGAFVQYTIYASSQGPTGPFDSVIAVTNQAATSAVLTNYLAAGQNWWFYMEASYNCPGATVLQSDTIDNKNPATPAIINVDVVNGLSVLNWKPSTSPQTQYYVIYYYLPNGLARPVDTVFGRFTTTYTDTTSSDLPDQRSMVYTIAAADSCQKIGKYTDAAHNTIYLTSSITACQRQVNLAWNKYQNWPNGVRDYEIWVSKNSGPFTFSGTADTTNLTFGYTDFNDGDSLCIKVRAVSAADTTVTSNSNTICFLANVVQPPSYVYITNLTVGLDNHITITWVIDSLAQLIYEQMHQSTNNVSYNSLGQINPPYPLTTFQTYVDSVNITPQNNPYYYIVDAFDSCQTEYLSPYGETVSLQGELYDYYLASLTWNDFALKYATVLRYNLYRDYGNGYQLIKTFLPGVNQYSDSLQQFLGEKGTFCYRIEAVYYLQLPAPSNYHDTLSSFSNIQCIIHRPIIYVPNAFAPNGVNSVFKPTIIYGNPAGYSMIIFNRWGGKVFESNDPSVGWDGTDHGKPAEMGGYGYLIQFQADDGVQIERKGLVLLVR